MKIIQGPIKTALKIVVYGPEGIGKSTFASQFPSPIFIDTEGSTKFMDVVRYPAPSSWTMLMETVRHVKSDPLTQDTLVIDTADWAEALCIAEICDKRKVSGIEDFGYGKGYVYAEEEFGRLLNLLEEIVGLGINVVLNCHAQMRKFEQPDELGAYDRWELKLEKKTAALIKEWADVVLFANYKTYVVNVDNQGAQKGKNKAQGGKRVMYTQHHPCWDAKNRHGLPEELPFEYAAIAHIIPARQAPAKKITASPESPKEKTESKPEPKAPPKAAQEPETPEWPILGKTEDDGIPKALRDLMEMNGITERDIQAAVARNGYYPIDTPIKNYDQQFINAKLVGAWPKVFNSILNARKAG